MKEGFDLSKKMFIVDNNEQHLIMEKDVKEFIRLLKEELKITFPFSENKMKTIVDKLAGSKLVK